MGIVECKLPSVHLLPLLTAFSTRFYHVILFYRPGSSAPTPDLQRVEHEYTFSAPPICEADCPFNLFIDGQNENS